MGNLLCVVVQETLKAWCHHRFAENYIQYAYWRHDATIGLQRTTYNMHTEAIRLTPKISKTPQNLMQSISFDKICQFLATSSLCRLTPIRWPSSSCAAMLILPMASWTHLFMWFMDRSCFFNLSDRCLRSVTPVLVQTESDEDDLKSRQGKQTGAILDPHPVNQAFLSNQVCVKLLV